MRKGLLIIALAVSGLLTACGGQAGQLPQDYVTYGFDTRVDVATTDPTPGRRVDLTVAVTSIGNAPVHCDVILHIVADNGDFGSVCEGSFKDLVVTISNSGTCPLKITNVASSSPEFKTAQVLSYPDRKSVV